MFVKLGRRGVIVTAKGNGHRELSQNLALGCLHFTESYYS